MMRRVAFLVALLVVVSGVLAGAVAGGASYDTSRPADLDITQPHYIDESVAVNDSASPPRYEVKGQQQQILPQNFESDAVTSYGVDNEQASLSFDQRTGEYTLQTDVSSGTFLVYWDVIDEVETNNTTQTRQIRYEAQVRVTDADYVHIERGEHEQLQEDAANFSAIESTFDRIGPAGQPLEDKIQDAVSAYQFINNPLRLLSGDFFGALTILTFTHGGRLLLGLLLLAPLAMVAGYAISYRRLQQRVPDYDDIETERMKLFAEKLRKLLVYVTPHELPVTPRTAERMSDTLGENLREIRNRVLNALSESVCKRIYLQAMGYRDDIDADYAQVQRTEDGQITDVSLISEADLPDEEDKETIIPLRNVTEDVADAVQWSQIDIHAVDETVPMDEIDVPVTHDRSEDSVMDELDIDIPEDFDDRKTFAEAMYHLFGYVDASEYTDEDGLTRPEQTALNTVAMLVSVTAEQHDVALDRRWRDIFAWIADQESANKDLRSAAQKDGIANIDTGVSLHGND